MVLKTTFGRPQNWSLCKGTLGVEDGGSLLNTAIDGRVVFILGGLISVISLYILP